MNDPWIQVDGARLDRAAHRRDDPEALADADAVVVDDGRVVMSGTRVAIVPAAARPAGTVTAYLGQRAGRDVVAVTPEAGFTAADGNDFVPLREALTRIDVDEHAVERDLAATAVAMATWHARHPRCAVCGSPTQPRQGGWARHCPRDGREHYPRTDPAVIVAITDDDDRLLLAHVSYHPASRYTHLAGYVEPGEALEQAAHREVGEESGLRIRDLAYAGSQSWPFPSSIMVAFTARAETTRIEVDGKEVTDARWLTRPDLAARVAEGAMVLAPPGSIARRLVHDWYGGPVPGGPADD